MVIFKLLQKNRNKKIGSVKTFVQICFKLLFLNVYTVINQSDLAYMIVREWQGQRFYFIVKYRI